MIYIACMLWLSHAKPNQGFPGWILDVLTWKSNTKENYCLQLHARDPNARLGAPNQSREGTPHHKEVDSTLSCSGKWVSLTYFGFVFGWLMDEVRLSQNEGWNKMHFNKIVFVFHLWNLKDAHISHQPTIACAKSLGTYCQVAISTKLDASVSSELLI